MDTHLLLLFLGVDLLLVCTPGPDWLYVVARALGQGRATGLTAVLGICAGYAVHTLLAAAGLAAALRAVPAALPVLRYAGAGYLVLIAVRMLRSARRGGSVVPEARAQSTVTVLRQSMLTALLNPKGLLLYLTLIPQFISPGPRCRSASRSPPWARCRCSPARRSTARSPSWPAGPAARWPPTRGAPAGSPPPRRCCCWPWRRRRRRRSRRSGQAPSIRRTSTP